MKLSGRFSALLTAALICCTAAPLSVSAVRRKTDAALPEVTQSQQETFAALTEITGSQQETESAPQKTSIDYSCTVDEVIAIKGLKENQYTVKNNILSYRCKSMGKEAVTCCYFYNGVLAFSLTGIIKADLPDSELQSVFDSIVNSYSASLGEPTTSYENIQGGVWKAGENYVIAAYPGDAVVTMNMSKSYMNELISGNTVMPNLWNP